ncbi:hypothetical protein LT493_31445 [Streptomyces tricolor]|nr:hypothetical protein [Streptomyces tricolor]
MTVMNMSMRRRRAARPGMSGRRLLQGPGRAGRWPGRGRARQGVPRASCASCGSTG